MEIQLWLTQQQEIRDCCAHIFTEMWLTPPNEAIALDGHAVFRADWTQDLSGLREESLHNSTACSCSIN